MRVLLLRLLLPVVFIVGFSYVVVTNAGGGKSPASASSTSWNPAVTCVPVLTTIQQVIGTQTNSNGGATQAGGWYGGQSIPDKTSLTPPCTVNGAPMFVEVDDVNVEGMTCNSFTGGNDGDCWGNLWDNSSGSMTYLNQIHAEIAGTWITAGIAPSVPVTNSQIDIQGFVYWDPYHLNDAWHSYSGWEIHPVSAWRATGANDFSITVSPSSGTVTGGSSATATVSTAVTGGVSQQLSLAASGLPAGATATFNPSTISAGASSRMTITAGTSTPTGPYTVTVTASGSSTTHSVGYALTVNGPASTSITNGGFESGSLSPWTPAGSASTTTSSPHTGNYAAMLGKTTATKGDSSITQSFLAPSGGGTLSFWYSISCADTVSFDWATASLTDNSTGTVTAPLPHTCPSTTAWMQATGILTGGDYYTLALINHDDGGKRDPTYTKYDDVAIQVSSLSPPSGLTAAEASSTEIDLSWSVVSGATGYTVQRSPDGATWTTLTSTTQTGYRDTGLAPATTYYYRVRATNGATASAYTAAVSALTAPSTPTGLAASASAPNTISLQWNDVAGETGFTVQRSTDGTTWASLATLGANITSYSDTGLSTGGTYYYRVSAFDAGGSSAPSATVSATATGTTPPQPTGVSATAVSASEIDVQWQSGATATGYRLERSPDGSTGWTAVYTGTATSYHDLGLTAATAYYYRVFATNSAGDSPASATVSATTLSGTPPAPTGLRAAALSSTSTRIDWGPASGAANYQVQRSPDGAIWTTVASTGQTSYADAGLAAATSYIYRVIAANSAGTSPPSTAVTVTTFVTPCPCTAWAATTTPKVTAASDSTANELGVKFRVDLPGSVTGLRFYKGVGNTGTHTAHLWDRTGALVASATFSNETATGWQQVSFPTPIPVAAATTYVASYFAPAGHYAADQNYFATTGVDNGPIHLLANGSDGSDGVYKQSTSGFPTYTYNASNYWVDILYTPNSPATPASVTASPQPAGQITIGWATVTGATDYSISYSSDGATGWTVIGSTTTQTSWTDVRPQPGAANYYRVSADSAGGTSPPSTVVSATPTG